MKQYVLDELRLDDFGKFRDYFDRNCTKSGVEGVYWIELEHDMLSDTQKQHKSCKPFYFAIILNEKKICCELLVRSMNKVSCKCINYASTEQINRIIQIIDGIAEQLSIIT